MYNTKRSTSNVNINIKMRKKNKKNYREHRVLMESGKSMKLNENFIVRNPHQFNASL